MILYCWLFLFIVTRVPQCGDLTFHF
uniref:Uncharacterized protein n=1 Tax=Anguilla anguilla TaxID=7936 RepID=A0A0E9VA69_ANGAN